MQVRLAYTKGRRSEIKESGDEPLAARLCLS